MYEVSMVSEDKIVLQYETNFYISLIVLDVVIEINNYIRPNVLNLNTLLLVFFSDFDNTYLVFY